MSADDVAVLRLKLERIETVLEERALVADRNHRLIQTVIGILVVQIFGSLFFAGQKAQKIEMLAEKIITIEHRLNTDK
jgi:hypothetical protein